MCIILDILSELTPSVYKTSAWALLVWQCAQRKSRPRWMVPCLEAPMMGWFEPQRDTFAPSYIRQNPYGPIFSSRYKARRWMTSSPYSQFHLEYWTLLRNASAFFSFSFNFRNHYWQKSRARSDSFRYWDGSPTWRTGSWKTDEICHVHFRKCFSKGKTWLTLLFMYLLH